MHDKLVLAMLEQYLASGAHISLVKTMSNILAQIQNLLASVFLILGAN